MSRPCQTDHAPRPDSCRLCWLYEHDDAYRALWDGRPVPDRSLPCVYLGDVLDRLGRPCPGKWLRRCGRHGTCTIETCRTCGDYDPAD
jgi:hypothetical protein